MLGACHIFLKQIFSLRQFCNPGLNLNEYLVDNYRRLLVSISGSGFIYDQTQLSSMQIQFSVISFLFRFSFYLLSALLQFFYINIHFRQSLYAFPGIKNPSVIRTVLSLYYKECSVSLSIDKDWNRTVCCYLFIFFFSPVEPYLVFTRHTWSDGANRKRKF